MSRPEGQHGDKDKAENGCGRIRSKDTAVEEEKTIYNAGMVSADTAYCHHFDKVTILTL